MQDRSDAGQEVAGDKGCRRGGMREIRDAGQEECRRGGMVKKEGWRKGGMAGGKEGGMEERSDAREKGADEGCRGCGTRGMQERR